MKTYRNTRRIAAIILALAMLLSAALLPACTSESADPAGKDPGTGEPTSSPSDGETEDLPVPFTDEEAEARFGHAEAHALPNIDGQYVYYVGTDPKDATFRTMYRYDCATGGIELVCRKPDCDHTEDSDCPFAGVMESTEIAAINGGVVYHGIMEDQIRWYDPETGESRVYDLGLGTWGRIFKAGNAVYYRREDDPKILPDHCQEMWRLDLESGDSTMVGFSKKDDFSLAMTPYWLDGKETVIRNSSKGPNGEEATLYYDWLYRIDCASVGNGDDETLLYAKELPTPAVGVSGKYFFYVDTSASWNAEDKSTTFTGSLHIVDSSTGEEQIVTEKGGKYGNTVMTDHCILYLMKDPERKNAYILHCYDYHTGERTEYPLRGEIWESEGGTLMYDRGKIYFTMPGQYDEIGRPIHVADLVVWDIATGRQQVIRAGEISEEH